MTIVEMNEAFKAAQLEVRRAHIALEENATLMAELLVGRLSFVSVEPFKWQQDHLAKLKSELRKYNTRTRKWTTK